MQCPYCKEEVQDEAIKCKHCGSLIGSAPWQPAIAWHCEAIKKLCLAALQLWKANLGDLVVLTLVFMLLVWIPVANIGFIAGYARSLIKVARGQGRAKIRDLFKAWDCFGNLLAYCIINLIALFVLGLVPVIGHVAALAMGFVVAPGMYAIIDNKRSALDAYQWSFESIQNNFVAWLLAYLVGGAIAGAGSIAFFIGVILTTPLGSLIHILQYEEVKPAQEGLP